MKRFYIEWCVLAAALAMVATCEWVWGRALSSLVMGVTSAFVVGFVSGAWASDAAMRKDQWIMVEGNRYTPEDDGSIVMEHRHPCGTPDSEEE